MGGLTVSAPINVSPTNLRTTADTVASAVAAVNRPGRMFTVGTGSDSPPPSREFSTMITGGLWPETSATHLRDTAAAQRAHAAEHDAAATHIQGSADTLGAQNSGATIDAAVEAHYGLSYTVRARGTTLYSTATAVDAAADHVEAATAALDQIDQETNATVEQIRGTAQGADTATRMAAHSAMLTVLSEGRGTAETTAGSAAAAVTGLNVTDIRGSSQPDGQPPKPKPAAGIRGPSEPAPAPPVPPSAAAAVASAPAPPPAGAGHGIPAIKPEPVAKVGVGTPFAAPMTAAVSPRSAPIPQAVKGFDAAMTAGRTAPTLPNPAAMRVPPTPTPAPAAPQTVTAAGPAPAASPLSAAPPPTTATPLPASPTVNAPPAAPATGSLPPFGFDRPAIAAAPSPSPPAAAPPTVSPAALPPAMPAVGASAVAASLLPPRNLMDALDLVNELQHASRGYACIDWAAGTFLTASGPVLVATSNEGAGYIPAGVDWPIGVRMLFADPAADDVFRAQWFGWANPAATLVTYAREIIGHVADLVALAVSTNDGGSAAPARGVVLQYAETALSDDEPTPNDSPHLHRLAVIAPLEYARITTSQVAEYDLFAATIRALTPAPNRILALLAAHQQPTDEDWDEATEIAATARFKASLHRPGRIGADDPGGYHAAYTEARAAELLTHWHADPPELADIAYTIKQLGQS